MRGNRSARRAITMAETIVSSLLIGLVLVGTIQLVGPLTRAGTVSSDRLVASGLARELSEEIATKLFITQSDADRDRLGAESGESRSGYDDIDDYHGMKNSPPELSNEFVISHLTGWRRDVEVAHVTIDDPSVDSAEYTGLKRVTVTVSKNGVELAQVISLHGRAADRLGFVFQEP